MMKLTDLSVKLVDYSVMENTSMRTSDMLNSDGSLKEEEDCDSKYPDVLNRFRYESPFLLGRDEDEYVPSYENSECKSLNNKLKKYSSYEKSHKMLALNLEITANGNKSVNVSEIRTYMNVPSGRDITKKVYWGNSEYEAHTPYSVGDKSGYLNSGLSRTINMWTDLMNEESLVDIVIRYMDQEKLYRLEF
ncbi:MAG TPA: hypothetical protein QF549_00965 [Candidatus Saccharimonadaceae bacterium]|nr:hypothetical protein [Candidatus Saccharimonadaceae bacterium]